MERWEGKSVCAGVAIGPIQVFRRNQQQIKRTHIEDVEKELERLEEARIKAIHQLGELYDKALKQVGESGAMIFQIHQMMLDDLDYRESIINHIRTQQVNAEYAVGITADNFSEMFSAMDDAYMRERAADVKDVSERLIKVLSGQQSSDLLSDTSVVVAADDLAPSETVQLDKSKIMGIITLQGATNSHTAILARTMNIPAVIGLGAHELDAIDGKLGIIDGFTGKVYIEPDEETLREMKRKKTQADTQNQLLEQLKGKPNITQDGQQVQIYANIGNLGDIGLALKNDAGGIGLFRSEFLYLESKDFPTEEEQFQVYKQAVQNMAGKRVIIRTLDIGADKQVEYFNLPKEENPALGYRAIRICLKQTDIFKTQLRSLLRASAFGKLAIMFPMIISLEEVKAVKTIVKSVKAQLKEESIPFDEQIELGIMIETPASALISEDLAKEVDFFSVGTNDLIQYTLAIDRQNNRLGDFCDPHHKAVLRLIRLATENAHREGKWIGICGELAADSELTEMFLAMGVDELSVSPGYILGLRKKVRETNVSTIRKQVLSLLD